MNEEDVQPAAQQAATLLLAALRSDSARVDELIERIRSAETFALRVRLLAELALLPAGNAQPPEIPAEDLNAGNGQ